MGWSIRVASIAGITVQIHFTFAIFLAWMVLSGLVQGKPHGEVISDAIFTLALFGCVVLHEFGHALTAKRYGIRTKDITLLPIGGVARLEKMPDDPRQELWVALAGPAVNIAIAGAIYLVLKTTADNLTFTATALSGGALLQRLLLVNISLVVFNLVPAFPMDGGRVLRALLAHRLDYTKATQVAAHLGQAIAVLFGIAGFFFNPFLMFIALFVWIGAAQEAGLVQIKSALAGIPVRAAMLTDFQAVTSNDGLSHVADLILRGSQHDFPVVDGTLVVGVVTRDDVLRNLVSNRTAHVGDVMRRDIARASDSEMLESALQQLQSCDCHTLPVVRNGALVGLLTPENIGEYLMIRAALSGREPHEAEVALTSRAG